MFSKSYIIFAILIIPSSSALKCLQCSQNLEEGEIIPTRDECSKANIQKPCDTLLDAINAYEVQHNSDSYGLTCVKQTLTSKIGDKNVQRVIKKCLAVEKSHLNVCTSPTPSEKFEMLQQVQEFTTDNIKWEAAESCRCNDGDDCNSVGQNVASIVTIVSLIFIKLIL